MEKFVQWLADTPWSIALHEFLYMYSITETTHVIFIMLFVGTIAAVDLRLLGVAFRNTPVSGVLSKMLPWTVIGFLVLAISGAMLFYAIPVRTYHSVWFRIKFILLVIGALNIGIFTFVVERNKAVWDTGPTPTAARICAIISLTVWIGVVVFGRLIAYNWFDCDEATSAFILQVAGCPAGS